MAAPNPVEIANLKVWSLYRHYFANRALYVGHGRAVVAGIRPMLLKVQALAPAQLVPLTVTEDDIAAGLDAFLSTDKKWLGYISQKAHMTGVVQIAMTDTMARFIAWDGYADIIK